MFSKQQRFKQCLRHKNEHLGVYEVGKKWSSLMVPLRVSFGLWRSMAFQVITRSTGSMYFTQTFSSRRISRAQYFSAVLKLISTHETKFTINMQFTQTLKIPLN